MGWGIFEEEGTSEKGCVEIEDRDFSVHFVLGFQENPIYTYVLAKILQNGAKFIQRKTPGFKNYMRNSDNFRQAVESPKSWNLLGYFCPKNTFLQLKSYIQRMYLTLISIMCENLPNYICNFWNHNWFFTTQIHCIFFWLIHYILSTKVAHQSAHFQTFHCLR